MSMNTHGVQNGGLPQRGIEKMVKHHSINSGRVRGKMNNTTIRTDSNPGNNRYLVKKTVSPSNNRAQASQYPQNFEMYG